MALLSKKAARTVLYRILAMYPDATTELNYDTPFHLLCAVIMSAQTTDKQVNKLTPEFFEHYPDALALSQASIEEIELYISSIGLYHAKARNLKKTATILVEQFNGQVPDRKADLLQLAGVGIKTANVVLAEIYHIPAIAVDTHVARIAKKFKIVAANATPEQVEQRLESILPQEDWVRAHHAMIMFGRYTMTARAQNQDPYSYLPPLKKEDLS
ncbi:EndoIII-related endonuclease [Amylolactobacillus amylotrophicus DSM 20534]|uniref:Endonuclease III n=3 Tax=Amylolactobacillus TaxID=2767876 RepID=A0A0R1YL55_9LACO|nr:MULTISPECIES: endonuclease III [Amylolactobacillus]APT19215.1 endonuclease III [Amylolactobacillus amylophilus DSM 20533 = JCM 1125]KRK38510.1 EndoIII-related endonuclease [Amylolactobacillus amylotrophicus DSM 20534]KRM42847.1 EndoIII-related endonuclease [Amylolactobacillus amylophilus DSM 20533 = JCM 1125]GED79711.1 endonuclease III [Amylolactobacillus amylophilus]